MINYFLQINCFPGHDYYADYSEKTLLYSGLFLLLILISSKMISWVLPKSKKAYTSTVDEPVKVNILPLESFQSYPSNNKTTFIARLLIIALILVFIFRPISEVLNLS